MGSHLKSRQAHEGAGLTAALGLVRLLLGAPPSLAPSAQRASAICFGKTKRCLSLWAEQNVAGETFSDYSPAGRPAFQHGPAPPSAPGLDGVG